MIFSKLLFCFAFGGFSLFPFAVHEHLQESASENDPVAAIVGDTAIYVSQVDHEFAASFSERDLNESLRADVRYKILDRLVQQQLILERLSTSELLATDDEVNLEIARLGERLTQKEDTLENFLRENQQSMSGLKFNYRWQISWQRYLDATLTDSVLEKYFNGRRRQFDGTKIRAAHILFKMDRDSTQDLATLKEKTQAIADDIRAGRQTWAEAIRAHALPESQERQGSVGWIGFDGPMSRSFTEAAFELDAGEIADPVLSPFGLHIIKCEEIKTGTRSWYDVRRQVRKVATQDLFSRLATMQAKDTTVRLTGEVPNPQALESNVPDTRKNGQDG